MALLLSNLSLDHDVAMAKTLSIGIVSTVSSHIVDAACARDIVRQVSELYLSQYSMRKSRLKMLSIVPKLKPLQLALSISCIRKFILNRYGINFE